MSRAISRRRARVLNGLRLAARECPEAWWTRERAVSLLTRRGIPTTTGDADLALKTLDREGWLSDHRIGRRRWWCPGPKARK